MGDCVFCKIVAGTAPATIVKRWPDAVAFTPLNPVTLGHMLVVPAVCVPDFTTDADISAIAMSRAAEIARMMQPTAHWNLITSKGQHATQSVFHLHVHLVPRRVGDGLHLPWTGQEYPGE